MVELNDQKIIKFYQLNVRDGNLQVKPILLIPGRQYRSECNRHLIMQER